MGSIAIDDGGFGGPYYSEELSRRIDQAIKDISDECLRKKSITHHQHAQEVSNLYTVVCCCYSFLYIKVMAMKTCIAHIYSALFVSLT